MCCLVKTLETLEEINFHDAENPTNDFPAPEEKVFFVLKMHPKLSLVTQFYNHSTLGG